jgi:hypothetical protein
LFFLAKFRISFFVALGGANMNWIRVLFFSVLMLGLAAPATAHASLFDSEQPGSVLVFPKFIRGVFTDLGASGEPVHAVTEIEISVVCPEGETCNQGTAVRMRGHWVCPGSAADTRCAETDFNLETTVNGTRYFNPEGVTVVGGVVTASVHPSNATTPIPQPPCERGYLIVWVIDGGGNAIKFDGLIGNALIRQEPEVDLPSWPRTARSYNAIPIQAVEFLPTGARTDQDNEGDLDFDETEYRKVTGKIYGTVRYENLATPDTVRTDLTLLTLDVSSNRPNPVTSVGLNFYTPEEGLASAGTDFFCWKEQRLTDILPSATKQSMGRKGLVESTFAEQLSATGNVVDVTLLGLIETIEFDFLQFKSRDFAHSLFHNNRGVNTQFRP